MSALELRDHVNQPAGSQVNPAQIGAMLRKLVEHGRSGGMSPADLLAYLPDIAESSPGCGVGVGNTLSQALSAQAVPYRSKLGACPADLDRFLCWLMRSTCSYNKFGQIGHTKLVTNTLTLPDPTYGFDIGFAKAQLGVDFPPEWAGESAYRGIYRVKVSIDVSNVNTPTSLLTAEDIAQVLLEGLSFRIIQTGTDLDHSIAMSFGEPQDAQSSTLMPNIGGFFLECGNEFVPFAFDPTLQSFAFKGTAPGEVGDSYQVKIRISAYFREIC